MNSFDPANPYGYLDEVPEYDDLTPEVQREIRVKGCLYGCISWAVGGILVLLSMIFFSSCSTKERIVTVERVHTDTLYVAKVQRDSVFMHDSIHVREKGDTVLVERWHIEWRDRLRTDTVYQSRRDTVPVAYEVVKEVPRELTWWQRARLALANIVLIVVGVAVAVWVVNRRRD